MSTTMLFSFLLGCSLLAMAMGDAVTSKFNVLIPKELSKPNGYDHRDALFGIPPYGGTIQQQVYYADSTLCDSTKVDPTMGYPTRTEPWKSPFILLVDRGDCSFVQKVRNAQRAGASAVLIADNICICGHDECQDDISSGDGGNFCESQEPIMADDGSGSDISIASFLLFKEDAQPLIAALRDDTHVRAQMSFSVPAPDSRVEYDLWTSPADSLTRELQEDFQTAVAALSDHAYFTPHMYIYDGVFAGCHSEDGQDLCLDLCSNNGRYCSVELDLNSGATGAEVVAEALRRICVWNLYGKDDGVGLPWWNYVAEFTEKCDSGSYADQGMVFSSEVCVAQAMEAAGIDKKKVDHCMEQSGGVTEDQPNTLLDKELQDQENSGIVLVPSLLVNQAVIRGFLNFETTFKAICAGFAAGSEPAICQMCANCPNERVCVQKGGHCGGNGGGMMGMGLLGGDGSNGSVSSTFFLTSMVMILLAFSLVGYVQYRRQETYMRDQIRGVVAEYMPVETQNAHVSTSLALDGDEDDDDNVHTFGAPDSALS